ncbi:MAG TPA: peptide ABC transporter substrate-binding protein [Planococcus sp. (in: firmicutes)]|nr:peptide ABC transporter substrate-binding protein [Planococcus sp. (in: firmicutes)]
MKTFLAALAFISCFALSGCGQREGTAEHLDGAYSLALKLMIETDPGLNKSMDYIAVDMATFTQLTDEDKENILSSLETKYGVDAMDASFEELKAQGLYEEETGSLAGILLTIEEMEYHFNGSVTFTGGKLKSGVGAVGVESTLKFDGTRWKIQESKQTWVS